MERPAEYQLAIECCRRNFRGGDRRPLPPSIDWEKFLRLVAFHRIEGLANRALRSEDIPTLVREALSAGAVEIAARNLSAIAACRLLLARFSAAQVPLLFVKGLTLGSLAYGNPALKSAIDVDVLIDPSDLGRAANCLRDAGFELVAPQRALTRWHRSWKESVWREPRLAIQLDLHTRLADNPRLIPTINAHSPNQAVDVGSGVTLPTLASDELLVYLAVHGAGASWFRLKWIADFAALLSAHSTDRITSFFEFSQQVGGGRAAAQALLLAHTLFGSLNDLPDLVTKLQADRGASRLLRIALAMLARAPAEPTERFFGTVPIHLSQFAIVPGAANKLAELRRQANQYLTRATI